MSDPKSFLGRVTEIFKTGPKKKNSHSKKRSLQLESLETRELLTVVGFHSVQNAEEGGQAGYFRLERNDTAGELTVRFLKEYGLL